MPAKRSLILKLGGFLLLLSYNDVYNRNYFNNEMRILL